MPIVITKEKGVPRRLLGFSDDVEADIETAVPEEPSDAQVYDPEEVETNARADPYLVAAQEVPDEVVDTQEESSQGSIAMGTLLTLPFFAYLAWTPRLPTWARLVSGMLGAGLLFSENGPLHGFKMNSENYNGAPRRRLRGYSTPFGEISFSQGRGLGCGCGCNGKPGGCGG